jgi:hypothetical protein
MGIGTDSSIGGRHEQKQKTGNSRYYNGRAWYLPLAICMCFHLYRIAMAGDPIYFIQ